MEKPLWEISMEDEEYGESFKIIVSAEDYDRAFQLGLYYFNRFTPNKDAYDITEVKRYKSDDIKKLQITERDIEEIEDYSEYIGGGVYTNNGAYAVFSPGIDSIYSYEFGDLNYSE